MMRITNLLALTVLAGVAYGTPPVAGGFMTGPDSTVYVYWFHPETQAWDLGVEADGGTFDIYPSSTPGFYSMAQRALLPSLSLVTTFSEQLYIGDHHPTWPGNQFSPFGFSVYAEDDDSLPDTTPIVQGRDSLFSADAAADGWVHHQVCIPNLTGAALWFSHDWDPQTPAAPEIKAAQMPDAVLFNRLGIGTGETRQWSGLGYALVFRYRFLTIIAPDSSFDCGWRKTGNAIGPDGFLITRYGTPGEKAITKWCNPVDTLVRLLPDGPGDSVGIRAGCDGAGGEEELMLTFAPVRVLPISVEVECGAADTSSGVCACNLRVTSRSPDTLRLSVGYDRSHIRTLSDRITVPPEGGVMIPAIINWSSDQSRRFAILFEETSTLRYPYLIMVDYSLSGPAAVGEPRDIQTSDGTFSVLPNPIISGETARFKAGSPGGRLVVFNILGQRVAEFSLDSSGETIWDERDENGRFLPSGVYFARLEGGHGQVATVKLILVR
jgi:hypothetical protein